MARSVSGHRIEGKFGGCSPVVAGCHEFAGIRRADKVLRRPEDRYRSLVEQIPAVTYIEAVDEGEPEHKLLYVSPQIEAMLGYRPEEWLENQHLWGELIHPEDRERVLAEDRRTDATGEPFRAEYRMFTRDGRLIWVRNEAVLMPNAEGRPTFWQGVIYDLSERKRTEEDSRLLRDVALAASEAEDLDSALSIALRAVCETTGWSIGQIWMPKSDGSALECSQIWYGESENLAGFKAANEALVFEPGVGLPGRAWSSQQPAWTEHIMSEDFPRSSLATRFGIRAGVAIPIVADAEVVAVMDFLVTERREEDERFIGLVVGLGIQLGSIMRRKQAEEALRKSEARNRAIVSTASDAIITMATDGSIRSFNRAAERIFGYAFEEVAGEPLSILMPERFRRLHEVNFRRYLNTGEAHIIGKEPVELAGLRSDGEEFPLELSLGEMREGDEILFTGVIRDITARKRVEEAFQEVSLQNELILASAGEGIYGVDLQGDTTFVNPAAARMLGYEPQELVGRPQHEIIHHTHPDGTPYARSDCFIYAVFEDGITRSSSDEVFWRKDGTSFPVEYVSTPINERGQPTGAVVTFRDITERQQTDTALRESEANLAEAQRIAHLGSWEAEAIRPGVPLSEHKIRWSDEMFRIFGFEPQQFAPTFKDLVESIHPQDREHVVETIQDTVSRRETANVVEHRLVRPDGEVRSVQARIEIVYDQSGKVHRHFGTVLDITERKLAEETLRARERELIAAQRIASVGNWSFDVAGDEAHWSDEMYRIFGLDPRTYLTYREFLRLVHPGDRRLIMEAARRALKGEDRSSLDYRAVRPDGEVCFLHAQYEVEIDASGRATELIGTLQDVTGLRRVEAEVREQGQILDLAPVLIRNLDDEILLWNTGARSIYGWTKEEALGRVSHELLRSEHPEPVEEIKRKVLDDGRWEGEITHVRKDGKRVVVASLQVLHTDERGAPLAILEVNNDITEKREAEEQLRMRERRFRSLVQNGSDITWVTNEDGVITYVSPSIERNLGYTPEQLVGSEGFVLLHADDVEPARRFYKEVLENPDASPKVEMRLRRRDGSWCHVEAVCTNLLGDPAVYGVVSNSRDISERKQAENALRRSEEEYRDLFQNNPHPMWVFEYGSYAFLAVNDAAVEQYGYSRDEFLSMTIMDIRPEEDVSVLLNSGLLKFDQSRREELDYAGEWRHRKKDGNLIDVEITTHLIEFGGKVARLVHANDITERKRAQEELRKSEERFRSLVQNSLDVITVVDAEATILYYSPSARIVIGYNPEEFIGKNILEAIPIHPDDLPHVGDALDYLVENPGVNYSMEFRMRHADGSWRMIEATANNLLEDPSVGGIVTNYRDITERKTFEKQLEHQAFHDDLTGLPNRALFMDRLEHALSRAGRNEGSVAVLFLDLDNFKVVNDSLGHEAGDEMLIAVAGRLLENLRPGDTVARLSGDEFIVLLEDIVDEKEATQLAERLAEHLQTPLKLRDQEVHQTASIGISLSSSDHRPEDLLRNADIAMHRTKTWGKAGYRVFDASMDAEARERLSLESDLRYAIEHNELTVYYQPKVLLATGEVVGFEALMRWNHPRRGMVSPLKFIPLAEESGLIHQLGSLVLRESCRQAREWQEQSTGSAFATMCVNLSAKQLQHPHLLQDVTRILKETGVDEQIMCLEITESVAMDDVHSNIKTLNALKSIGLKMSIDDFGTGYSSLAYLNRLPVDSLKIDRSFVNELGNSSEAESIVLGTIQLAHALNMQVTAEGVETVAQLERLREMGCDLAQGFYFSEALKAADAGRYLPGASGPPRFDTR